MRLKTVAKKVRPRKVLAIIENRNGRALVFIYVYLKDYRTRRKKLEPAGILTFQSEEEALDYVTQKGFYVRIRR